MNAFTKFTNRLLDPGNLSDENVRQNQQMADVLLNQASNTQPMRSPWQGVAQLMQGLNAQIYRQRGEKGEQALKQQRAKQLGDFMNSLQLDPNQSAALQSAPEGIRDALLADVAGRQLAPEAPENPFSKINPKDYTPESIAQFQQTGNPSVLRAATQGKGPDQRERKIADLVNQGIPRDRAGNIVDGVERIEIVPETGNARSVNVATGKVYEIPIGSESPPPTAPEAGQSLWDLAQEGTGPVSATKAGASVVSGMFGGPISEPAVQARQTLTMASQNMIRALAINPRFPVAEMERLRNEISLEPSAFDSPSLMRSRMRAIDRSLRLRLSQAEQDAANTRLPRDVREAQASNASALNNYLSMLGVPDETQSGVPEGVDPELWEFMTPEQKALWQN